MKNFFKMTIAIVEWMALAAAITFGCAVGGEAASAAVDHIKKKGGEPIAKPMPEKVEP